MKRLIINNYKKSISYFSIVNSFRDGIIHEPMVSLGNSFELPALVNKIGWRVILACSDSPVNLAKRTKLLISFCKYILQMQKHHGATTTVKYLKAGQLAIFKAVAGNPFKTLRELEPDLPLPRLTSSGLPRWIPLDDRRAILSGSAFHIRFWGTLYALYRVIRVPGKLKLETITDPFSGDNFLLLQGIERLKVFASSQSFRFNKEILERDYGFLPLETSSPTAKSSWRGLCSDPWDLKSLGLLQPLRTLLDSFNEKRLWTYSYYLSETKTFRGCNIDSKSELYPMGQLAIKEEAAGKIRVFALVDSWTQSSLKPLHEMLFAFLKGLPNDGTFNQGLSVQRCMEKAKKAGQSFGYDLSAATDRLPIDLQVAILSSLIGDLGATAWKDLLVGRDYKLMTEIDGVKICQTLRYAVGQPMGALSSWAMLAVTHHFIVQLAFRSCRTVLSKQEWYDNYELLGDDIVIFDEDVAKTYLALMKGYGVSINQSKSVIANNASFEFAKVFAKDGLNLSPISWKMFISQNTNMGRVNICFYLLNSRYIKNPINYVRNIVRKNTWVLGDYKFCLLALISMFVKKNNLSYKEVLSLLIVPVENWNRRVKSSMENLPIGYLELVLSHLIKGLPLPQRNDQLIKDIAFNDEPWYKIALVKRLMKIKYLELTSIEMVEEKLVEKVISSLGLHIPEPCRVEWLSSHDSLGFPPDWEEYQTTYTMLLSIVRQWMGDTSFFDEVNKMLLNKTIDELILLNDKMDRLVEVSKLVERADEKLKGLVKNRERVDSPLKSLAFILKTNKMRPLFTMTTSPVKLVV